MIAVGTLFIFETNGDDEMGIIDLLNLDPEVKAIVIRYPRTMDAAVETLIYMNRHNLTKDEIIIEAIEEYLQRRLWAAKEKELNATQLQRVNSFKGSGIRQMRDN